MGDKWFATTHDDAVAFGQAFWRFAPPPLPRPFVVAQAAVPEPFLDSLLYNPWLDGIGPAYLVREDQLPKLNRAGLITVHETVYEPPR
jgi:hypothetical protein